MESSRLKSSIEYKLNISAVCGSSKSPSMDLDSVEVTKIIELSGSLAVFLGSSLILSKSWSSLLSKDWISCGG